MVKYTAACDKRQMYVLWKIRNAGMALTLFSVFFVGARWWSAGKISLRTLISAARRWKLFYWGHSRTGERVGELRGRVRNTSKRAGDDIRVFLLQERDSPPAAHLFLVIFRVDMYASLPGTTREITAPTPTPHVGGRRRFRQQDLSRRSLDLPLRS